MLEPEAEVSETTSASEAAGEQRWENVGEHLSARQFGRRRQKLAQQLLDYQTAAAMKIQAFLRGSLARARLRLFKESRLWQPPECKQPSVDEWQGLGLANFGKNELEM